MVHDVEMGFWEQKRRRRRAALQSRPWQQHSFLVDGATGALTHVRGTVLSITDASHRTLRYAHAIDWDVTEEVRGRPRPHKRQSRIQMQTRVHLTLSHLLLLADVTEPSKLCGCPVSGSAGSAQGFYQEPLCSKLEATCGYFDFD